MTNEYLGKKYAFDSFHLGREWRSECDNITKREIPHSSICISHKHLSKTVEFRRNFSLRADRSRDVCHSRHPEQGRAFEFRKFAHLDSVCCERFRQHKRN